MKIDRHGQAKILTVSEIQLLFSQGLQNERSRALFGICLYCCCRINEACTLNVNDVYSKGRVRPELLIRKGNTKGKLATRSIPVIEDLRGLLSAYQHPERGYLFPGRWGRGHINSDSAARILREAMVRVGIEGGSTHSFRRTGLTQLSNAGIPLRVIQDWTLDKEVITSRLSIANTRFNSLVFLCSQLENAALALFNQNCQVGFHFLCRNINQVSC